MQDSTITFENLPFYCPNSTSAFLTFKPTWAIFTEISEEVQYGTLLFIGRVLILLGFHDTQKSNQVLLVKVTCSN